MKRVGLDRIDDLYVLNEADLRAKGPVTFDASHLMPLEALKVHVAKIMAEGAALTTRDLAIDGNMLMKELGLRPGRIIGVILETLLEAVINDPSLNEREKLLEMARKIVAEKA
jgi:tRNA nucleotidyltransferase (CCA-adding enzyme)